jgi:hypothetical protein
MGGTQGGNGLFCQRWIEADFARKVRNIHIAAQLAQNSIKYAHGNVLFFAEAQVLRRSWSRILIEGSFRPSRFQLQAALLPI